MTKNCKNQEVISPSVIAHLLRDLYSPTSSRKDLGRGAAMTHRGFTLAEVLITLAIVGVVAAITMPALIANIQERVKTARIQNITQKFGKATDKMKSLSTLGGYATTMDFVNELQKHLKIAKVCTNDKLTECWPTEKVIINDEGKEWEISKTTTGKQLKMTNDDTHEYGDTVGIVTADGTAMILTYNAKCDIDEVPITWLNNQSSTSGCVAAVFDWNGSKMPNKLSNDVITFNSGGLGDGCAFKLGDTCFKAPQLANKPLTYTECMAQKDALGLDYCYNGNDYYAGAAAMCGGIANMASGSDVAAIASDIYGKAIGSGSDLSSSAGKTYSLSIGTKYGFPDANSESFWVWYGHEESGLYARGRRFESTSTNWSTGYGRYASSGLVLCKGD